MNVPIDQVTSGMVLASDVFMTNGTVLVHADQTLTPQLIDILKRRNITEVEISDKQPAEKPVQADQTQQSTAEKAPDAAPQPDAAVPPKLLVTIADNQMSADLTVEPVEAANQSLSVEQIISALNAQGIIFGLDEKQLGAIASTFNKSKKKFTVKNVAKGVVPEPGKEGELEMKVGYLSDLADVSRARNAHYLWEIHDDDLHLERVRPGTILAQKHIATSPVPGKDVKGDILPCSDTIPLKLNCDSTVALIEDNQKVEAKIDGICYFADNAIGVLPINFDGTAEIIVSNDKMEASMVMHLAGEGGKYPSEKELNKQISDVGIVYGLKKEEVSNLALQLEKLDCPHEPIVIARGTEAIHGENGSIEFLFSVNTSLAPKANPDGTVDYKNVDIVHSVAKDQELARVIPPKKGVPGKNVLGNELPSKDGTEARLPLGTNTLTHPQKSDVMIAGTDGVVRYNGSSVEITEGYIIKGSVDFTTGNVKYAKSVTVNGDIKSGFVVECGGDLQVSGTIEDASVITGGTILCKLGFVGTGKGLIDSKGDVNLAFSKNQTIHCRQNINIAKESLNCNLCARKSIIIHGNPLSAAGGHLIARDSITVFTVGNMSGIKTIVEVGLDFTLVDELKKAELQIKEINENKHKLQETNKKYDQLLKIKKKLPPKEEFIYKKLQNTLIKYDQQISAFQERIHLVNQKMYDFQNAFIKIEHAAKPGTIFKFGERQYLVKDDVIGPKSVRLINHEIRII